MEVGLQFLIEWSGKSIEKEKIPEGGKEIHLEEKQGKNILEGIADKDKGPEKGLKC